MTNEEQILKSEIMMRVRFIYGVRSLPRVFVPKLAVLTSLVAVAGFFVSMPHVLSNMPSLFDFRHFTGFLIAAFLNTKFAIQVISLGSLAVAFLMVRDIAVIFRETGVLKTA